MSRAYEVLGLFIVLQFVVTGVIALLLLPLDAVASILPLLLFFSFVLLTYLFARARSRFPSEDP